MSLRRSIILNGADPAFAAGDAPILRWIGAAARKRGKPAAQQPTSLPIADNVTILKWEHTFGRKPTPNIETMDSSVVVVQFKPHHRTMER